MANKHIKRGSTSLAIKNMQNKVTMSCQLIPTKMAIIISVFADVETESSYTADWNVKWYCSLENNLSISFFSFFLSFFFCFFRAAPTAYGSSQARRQIRAIATSLHHSHRNVGSKPCL